MGPGAMRRFGEQLDQDGKLYDHAVVIRLLRYFRPYWPIVSVAFVAMLVFTATVVALPLLIRTVIDDYIRLGDLSGANVFILLFVGAAAAQFVFTYINQRLMAYVGQRVLFTLRVQLFSHIQKLSMSFFDQNETGRIMSRVQNDVRQLQEVISIFVNSFGQVMSLIGIVWAMMFLNQTLAAVTLSVIPVLFIFMVVWQRFARASFLRVRTAAAGVNSDLQENISGVRVVQSMNREQRNMRSFARSNQESLSANLQASRLSAALLPSVELLTALGLALVVIFGGIMVIEGTLLPGVLVAFAFFVQRFFEPVRNLTSEYGSLQRAMVAGSRIFEILDKDPDVEDTTDAVPLPDVKGGISYEGVGFSYEEGEPVLSDVDLQIAAGQTVAFVGATGAGKTTMVSLLMRLYDVTSGSIKIDDVDIREVTLESLSKQISVVPQEPYLFSEMSIRENIRYYRDHITDDAIERASRAVGAHEFISRLSQAYETPLQERGGNLSIGQRQLISFARALAAEPNILVLDEATANIDTESEMQIQRALSELLKGRTAVIIAHRHSTIRNADNIVVLDHGRMVEQGTHDDLMAVDGFYTKLSAFGSMDEGQERPRGGGRQGGRDMDPEQRRAMRERRQRGDAPPMADGERRGIRGHRGPE